MTGIPSPPQRSGSEAFVLQLRGLRLRHFRKGFRTAVRCAVVKRRLSPKAAVGISHGQRPVSGTNRPLTEIVPEPVFSAGGQGSCCVATSPFEDGYKAKGR
jgi:hypothetical protein